jgi:hypothetical protein
LVAPALLGIGAAETEVQTTTQQDVMKAYMEAYKETYGDVPMEVAFEHSEGVPLICYAKNHDCYYKVGGATISTTIFKPWLGSLPWQDTGIAKDCWIIPFTVTVAAKTFNSPITTDPGIDNGWWNMHSSTGEVDDNQPFRVERLSVWLGRDDDDLDEVMILYDQLLTAGCGHNLEDPLGSIPGDTYECAKRAVELAVDTAFSFIPGVSYLLAEEEALDILNDYMEAASSQHAIREDIYQDPYYGYIYTQEYWTCSLDNNGRADCDRASASVHGFYAVLPGSHVEFRNDHGRRVIRQSRSPLWDLMLHIYNPSEGISFLDIGMYFLLPEADGHKYGDFLENDEWTHSSW